MNYILHVARLRKYYYKIYHEIVTASQWVKAIYKPACPMTATYLSPIIFSVRKIANELLELADKLEKSLNDQCK